MVLANLLLKAEFTFAVAHMNFQLRGEESNKDEEFVRGWCEHNEIDFFFRRVQMEGRGSVQMEARDLRYSWFRDLLKEKQFSKIVVAHHLNDQLETMLLNLTRGTGIRGLAGMAPRSDDIIRPLLGFSKAEIQEYAQANGLEWREDASNSTEDYDRNKVRHRVIPELERLNPSFMETFRRTNQRLQGTQAVLLERIEQLKKSVTVTGDDLRIPLDWLGQGASDFELLMELLRPFGANFFQVEEILECSEAGRIFETASHTICFDRTRLIITEHTRPLSDMLVNGPGTYQWGNRYLIISKTRDTTITGNSELIAKVDASKAKFPMTVRSFRPGDHFYPLGSGRKKVSDFFIDQKVPRSAKSRVPIIESEGDIIWVGGHRIDDRSKITQDTSECLIFQLHGHE